LYAAVTTTQKTMQLPKVKKLPQIGLTFDPTEFPKLTPTKMKTTRTTTKKDILTTAKMQADQPTQVPYDYKAKLEQLSIEIETTLRKHFDDLFAQLESKIDNLVKQNEEQAQINLNVMKQLSFLVENMKKLTKYSLPPSTQTTPSPQGEGRL